MERFTNFLPTMVDGERRDASLNDISDGEVQVTSETSVRKRRLVKDHGFAFNIYFANGC